MSFLGENRKKPEPGNFELGFHDSEWGWFWNRPIAVWTLDQGRGSDFSLGHRFQAVENGSVPIVTSAVGLVRDFTNNSANFLEVAHDPFFIPSADFTVFIYMRVEDAGDFAYPFAKDASGGGETRAWSLFVSGPQDKLGLFVFKTDASLSSISVTNGVVYNEWHLYTVTYKFITDGTSELRAYRDGVEKGSNTSAVGPVNVVTSSVTIGERGVGDGATQGEIAYVGYTPSLFSPAQVAKLARVPFGPLHMGDEAGAVLSVPAAVAAGSKPPSGLALLGMGT